MGSNLENKANILKNKRWYIWSKKAHFYIIFMYFVLLFKGF